MLFTFLLAGQNLNRREAFGFRGVVQQGYDNGYSYGSGYC